MRMPAEAACRVAVVDLVMMASQFWTTVGCIEVPDSIRHTIIEPLAQVKLHLKKEKMVLLCHSSECG